MMYTTHAFSSLVTENADHLAAQEIGTTEVTSWQERRHYGWWAYPKEGQEVPQVHPQQAQIQKRWAPAQLFRWLLSLYYKIRWHHYLSLSLYSTSSVFRQSGICPQYYFFEHKGRSSATRCSIKTKWCLRGQPTHATRLSTNTMRRHGSSLPSIEQAI